MNANSQSTPFPWHQAFPRLVFLFSVFSVGISPLRSEEQSPAGPPTATETPVQAPAREEISHLGQTFVLARHQEDRSVETDEYLPNGETLGNWSQLLTVQRLRLSRDSSPGELIAHLEKRIASDRRSSLETVRQGRNAAVLSARLPGSGEIGEQWLIGIIYMDTVGGGSMNVLQFALVPDRLDEGKAEMTLDAWRQKFLRQADIRNKAGRVGD